MDKLEIELSEMRKKINNLEFYVMRLISKIDKVLEAKG